MLRDLISALDYSIYAKVALGLFVTAFVAITYGALRLSRQASDKFASIPLSDKVEDPRRD